ncbi:putative E3 ubiquitin ligase complex SCF subunit sconB [Cyphellophora attinorum]|uniref:Probable E3 ubiquitin ligase complex SCF subunit sconB n=1 Tax=Cyphellophora attinorum TaxID=1664694 RepID=A0A0N0NHN6_9EURO|nr:putative E3 ubiquitin ligase complex SCF subunit sconB [Phialophora attinorum]KPI34479.1 putative E3 ubiquitin ligase complex SCF subunit sconB [Phialophora attinorum]
MNAAFRSLEVEEWQDARGWDESPRKRMRSNSNGDHVHSHIHSSEDHEHEHDNDVARHKIMVSASTAKMASNAVAPFLAKHVPTQYAPIGGVNQKQIEVEKTVDPNSKYCYRHRPDMLCRKQADEPTMEALQKDLEAMPEEDRQGIVQTWSLFSAAPAKHRKLMLQGILAQCCFPQLSYLSANVRELIRIDFLAALPAEVSFRILSFLDTTSLCKAAQVSSKWRQLADDDVVWHHMCEQHIDRKCTKCGWGLPLLDRKRLRATKRQMQLRAAGRGLNEWSPAITPIPEEDLPLDAVTDLEKTSDGRLSPISVRQKSSAGDVDYFKKTRPWKDVYKDRFKVGTNWKYGRCNIKVLRGHSNGVMALQFVDNILATGSYDCTIKIWDLDNGEVIRTLTGHRSGIRCLQIDDTKLISGSLDKTLKVWNWRTGECLATHYGHTEGVISLHFDQKLVASGSADHTVRVWNFKDKEVSILRGHTDWVNSVHINSASRTLFTASDDCTVNLWDLDTHRIIRTYEGHVGHVQQVIPLPPEFVADDPVDDHISTDSRSFDDGHEEQPELRRTASVESYAALFPSQPDRPLPPRYILTSALDNTIRLWETSSGRCVRTYFGHVEGVWTIAADTLRIVSGSHDRTVKVWDPRSGKAEKTFVGHAGPVTCIGLSDGRICSGGEDGEVRVYDFAA